MRSSRSPKLVEKVEPCSEGLENGEYPELWSQGSLPSVSGSCAWWDAVGGLAQRVAHREGIWQNCQPHYEIWEYC